MSRHVWVVRKNVGLMSSIHLFCSFLPPNLTLSLINHPLPMTMGIRCAQHSTDLCWENPPKCAVHSCKLIAREDKVLSRGWNSNAYKSQAGHVNAWQGLYDAARKGAHCGEMENSDRGGMECCLKGMAARQLRQLLTCGDLDLICLDLLNCQEDLDL